MVKVTQKKTKKYRGSRTHGRGKKGGRGAGLRGGRGKAGLHKHKFTHMVKYMPNHFGRRGFLPPRKKFARKNINVGELENLFPGKNEINLKNEGFDKLLGKGCVASKIKVIVPSATKRAIEKVSEKGGEVIVEKGRG
jgi:large subunit ribosomal protein L15